MTDFINAPVLRLAIGSIEKLGMTRAAKGPRRMIEEDGRVSLLDIGTVAQIRAGRIKVRGDDRAAESEDHRLRDIGGVNFRRRHSRNRISPDLRPLLPDVKGVLSNSGKPLVSAPRPPSLAFCSPAPLHRQRGSCARSGSKQPTMANAAEALLAA